MIYLIIALGATIIGSLSGLGGGVIIKPLLDLVSNESALTISVLSAFTVLAMAITSIIKHILNKSKINVKVGVLLSIGALIGGNVGSKIFDMVLNSFSNQEYLLIIQSLMLAALLVAVLIYMNKFSDKKTYLIENSLLIVLTGFSLGTISSFLGIGGGPINIVVLTLLFSMGAKEASVNSILLVLFSQLSKVITVTVSGKLAGLDLQLLWLMIPAGIIGGFIGAKLNHKLTAKNIISVFNGVLIFIIGVNIVNVVIAVTNIMKLG